MILRRGSLARAVAAALALALSGCNRPGPSAAAHEAPPAAAPAATAPSSPQKDRGPSRDLAADEARGGHTLSRHVGKSDAELADRLRREPQISAASTYEDRGTAERSVGAALASAGGKLRAWEERNGRRPNLVLNYENRNGPPVGRSLSRGRNVSVPCRRALVVLKWDDRSSRFYVLTSYPEAGR